MEYKFTEIEEKWKQFWDEKDIYKVTEDTTKPKYYVLDMFPYPSGAGLHVGHPLGYVASDIYARYKRLNGFNVLHPMGYDAFGLPAEQYAIETGTHPAKTTETAIKRYREQMDKIGFSFDWSREVRTCEPEYYKWTQWIFLQLFNSWYNREKNRAEPISTLISGFETYGCTSEWKQFDPTIHPAFSSDDWKAFNKAQQERILQYYRLAYRSYTEVNWCEALGCVLANDEVKDGKSERGGYPVTRKKMRQWSLRITEYADRLLDGLNHIDWSESLKDQQRNWIGRSEGALLQFHLPHNPARISHQNLSQTLSEGEGLNSQQPNYYTTDVDTWNKNIEHAKEGRKNPTEAEQIVWNKIKTKQTGYKFRRQHPIDRYIPDFVCLQKGLIVEIDGGIHLQQKEYDESRTQDLTNIGFTVIRFPNEEVLANVDAVIAQIKAKLDSLPDRSLDDSAEAVEVPPSEGFREVAFSAVETSAVIEVFTTRIDTLFGATFLVIAPEHEYIQQLITHEQREEMDAYLAYVKSRSDIERQQEKKITGCFTGSYAEHPFTGVKLPIWTAEYVLAGYGTGAIMAVPADDERDRKFAEKFGLTVIEVIDKTMYEGATIEDKVGKMINSDFLNGMEVKDAIEEMIKRVEEMNIGKRQVNYKLRDASYSRQRYWGEPFPIKYEVLGKADSPFAGDENDDADMPVALDESQLPLVLPAVESYKPGGDGRSPLANNADWVKQNLETDTMPGYAGSSWYYFRYMDPHNPNAFAGKEAIDYWQNVDVYFGGAEHAVGHLLYSRFWHKVLFDLGYVPTEEPFKKLVNQGMIQGVSAFAYQCSINERDVQDWMVKKLKDSLPNKRIEIEKKINIIEKSILLDILIDEKLAIEVKSPQSLADQQIRKSFDLVKDELNAQNIKLLVVNSSDIVNWFDSYIPKIQLMLTEDGPWYSIDPPSNNPPLFISRGKKNDFPVFPVRVNIDYLENDALTQTNIKAALKVENLRTIDEDNRFLCDREPEKMSKSKYNVVNPDDVIAQYGADCFRMFEMFLGPIEQSKPWDDKGISGVSNFLKRFWRLFYDDKGWKVSNDAPTPAELKILHKTLKKISQDIENLNLNTSVSAFMIAVNELTAAGTNKRAVLEPLVIALAPFAPFITEELWHALGNTGSVHQATFPKYEEKYLVESEFDYPVSINGKVRAQIKFALDAEEEEMKRQVMELEKVKQFTNGATPKKFIIVKGRIINVVV